MWTGLSSEEEEGLRRQRRSQVGGGSQAASMQGEGQPSPRGSGTPGGGEGLGTSMFESSAFYNLGKCLQEQQSLSSSPDSASSLVFPPSPHFLSSSAPVSQMFGNSDGSLVIMGIREEDVAGAQRHRSLSDVGAPTPHTHLQSSAPRASQSLCEDLLYQRLPAGLSRGGLSPFDPTGLLSSRDSLPSSPLPTPLSFAACAPSPAPRPLQLSRTVPMLRQPQCSARKALTEEVDHGMQVYPLWPGLSPLLDKVELLCREALHLITLLLHYLHTALHTAATHTKQLNKELALQSLRWAFGFVVVMGLLLLSLKSATSPRHNTAGLRSKLGSGGNTGVLSPFRMPSWGSSSAHRLAPTTPPGPTTITPPIPSSRRSTKVASPAMAPSGASPASVLESASWQSNHTPLSVAAPPTAAAFQELLRQYSILGSGSGMDPPPPEPPTPHVIMDIHIPSRADIIRVVGHVSGGFFHVLSHVVCGLVLRLLRHVPFLRHLGRPSWC